MQKCGVQQPERTPSEVVTDSKVDVCVNSVAWLALAVRPVVWSYRGNGGQLIPPEPACDPRQKPRTFISDVVGEGMLGGER